ncbi:MAG: ATP-dependent RecD-like DNA helicase [Ruminococcus sp.]|nr:ATP-dependent RecD-like DNA helicase [Ruminococcus sp.]
MPENEIITISGEIDAVKFRNDENGYCIIMLKTADGLKCVVGNLGIVEQGEEIECQGYYMVHSQYGLQFKSTGCRRRMPTTVEAIQKYLSGDAIKGIGARKAKAIVDRFGEHTFDVIKDEPERLAEVEGISRSLAEDVAEQYKKIYAVSGLSVLFTQYGIPVSSAVKAFRRWGEDSEQLIKTNPYILCGEGLGVSFRMADLIGDQLGIPHDSEMRIKAGICEVLRKQAAEEKNTCMPVEWLAAESCQALGISRQLYDKVLTEQLTEEELFRFDKPQGHFIMLRDYFKAENYISRRLLAMKSCSYDNKIDFSEVIDEAERTYGIKYDERQREAINLSLSYGFLVITGGPGTGKTTTLNAIIRLLKDQGMNVMIAAPTGRAAKRISELTGCDAKTLHRLLEVKHSDDDRMLFVHDEKNMLECEALIIDEMSMVDTLLFESVLRGISLTCKLVLVGDSDQLPSVSAGNVLHDIIESGVMSVVKLEKIFRQAQMSKIVTTAHAMVNGEPIYLDSDKDSDFFFVPQKGIPEAQQFVINACAERLPKYYDCSAIDDIQVISPARQGEAGIERLNELLQEALNPPSDDKSEIRAHGTAFRVGDKVMQTKNDYDIEWKKVSGGSRDEQGSGVGIFNGDIGRIIGCEELTKQLTIDFDGRIAVYTSQMLENLELAYAITVHKSQGSEYNIVVLVVIGLTDRLCYRNMLYTAVTRAKKMLLVVGSKECFVKMLTRRKAPERNTCLLEMLKEMDNNGGEEDEETAVF